MNARRRVAWGMFDQVLSSASNFLVTIIAARGLPARGFGSFALALGICMVCVFLARGLASDPLSTAHAGDTGESYRTAVRAGAVTALVVGLCFSLLTALAAVVIGGVAEAPLLVLALILPGLTLQDYLRYVLIVRRDAHLAFVNDGVWMVLEVPLMVLAIHANGGAAALLAGWGAAGTIAALIGFVQAGTGPGRLAQVRPWLRRHRQLWPFFVVDNLVYQATQLVLVVVISVSASLADVGGFRAAVTVYAPLTIVGRGIVGVAIPEFARHRDDRRWIVRGSLVLAWALIPLTVVWGGALLSLPAAWGRAALGDSWAIARPLIALAGVTVAGTMFTVGTVVGIRALGAGREGLTARISVSVLAFACGAVGAVVDGAHGAMLLLAIATPVQAATWWWLLVRAARYSRYSPTDDVPLDATTGT